jgi:hypothetical protein
VPKAGLDDRTLDLRVVVIAGRARHAIVRLSRSPITNLHLLNDRADPAAVRRRMGDAAWADAMRTCERAMRCFPGSLHGGVDLLVTSDFRRHAILEVNAFGDLLPGVLSEGLGTYEAEIATMFRDRVVDLGIHGTSTGRSASGRVPCPGTRGHAPPAAADMPTASRGHGTRHPSNEPSSTAGARAGIAGGPR